MSSTLALSGRNSPLGATLREEQLYRAIEQLRDSFSESVGIWDSVTGQLLPATETGLTLDEHYLAGVAAIVADRSRPEIVSETGPVCWLAVPIAWNDGAVPVAIAPFLIGELTAEGIAEAAVGYNTTPEQLREWAVQQTIWNADALLKFATAIQAQFTSEARAQHAEREIEVVSENLATTYEEISLLYTITKNLRISSTDEELGRLAIERLEECLPAAAFAIQYLPVTAEEDATNKSRTRGLFLATRDCPVTEQEFVALIKHLEMNSTGGACLVSDRTTHGDAWPFPTVRQIMVVPLAEGSNVFGWLAAFNHRQDGTFGTVESNLLSSLGTLLGIHCGNRELYRQQSELLQNIVRALVSAIDAKDPYTSGHSDRVARFAVRIALEMRCSPKFINTVYMAGLLHDVGKIGIDDNVLRKAGRLTTVEFEHIKKHPELGYKILADLKQLAEVLPAVLHHHEQWDGQGYPHRLSGEEIPKIARIMAVADAFDAMSSDRPYRTGMPEEKVHEVFRNGSGKYWDPEVVEAFFNAKDDIRSISQRERAQVDSFQQQLV
jgi:HD-GYP domain-containing protein (c-di-GMP phosphodiesterase class II)